MIVELRLFMTSLLFGRIFLNKIFLNKIFLKANFSEQVVLTSLLLCFGAGVLLATALLHILPQVKLLRIVCPLNCLKMMDETMNTLCYSFPCNT